jgi:hypothetical protein
MSALREGKTLRALCSGKFQGKPVAIITTYQRFREYCAQHTEYASAALPLLEENYKAANKRKGARLHNRTHCKYGHPLSGENLYVEPNRRVRRCNICTRGWQKNGPAPSEEQLQRVTAALNVGQTLTQICRGRAGEKKIGGYILTFGKLKRYRELNPKFDRFVCSMVSGNADRARRRPRNSQLFHTNIVRGQTNDYHSLRTGATEPAA